MRSSFFIVPVSCLCRAPYLISFCWVEFACLLLQPNKQAAAFDDRPAGWEAVRSNPLSKISTCPWICLSIFSPKKQLLLKPGREPMPVSEGEKTDKQILLGRIQPNQIKKPGLKTVRALK